MNGVPDLMNRMQELEAKLIPLSAREDPRNDGLTKEERLELAQLKKDRVPPQIVQVLSDWISLPDIAVDSVVHQLVARDALRLYAACRTFRQLQLPVRSVAIGYDTQFPVENGLQVRLPGPPSGPMGEPVGNYQCLSSISRRHATEITHLSICAMESIPYSYLYDTANAPVQPVPPEWGQGFNSLRVLKITQHMGGPNLGRYARQLVAASAGTLRTLVLAPAGQPHHVTVNDGLAILQSLAGITLQYLHINMPPWSPWNNNEAGVPAHTRRLMRAATLNCTGLLVEPQIRCHIAPNPDMDPNIGPGSMDHLTPRPLTGEAAARPPQPTAEWFN